MRDDLEHPSGPRFVVGLVGITSAVLVLLLRRRFPFAAPAATWLLCAGLSFLDAQSRTPDPLVSFLKFAAVLKGRKPRGGREVLGRDRREAGCRWARSRDHDADRAESRAAQAAPLAAAR